MRPVFFLPILLTACEGEPMVNDRPPSVAIQTPADGTGLVYGQITELKAVVSDDLTASADLRVLWTSDLDGVLSTDAPWEGAEGLAYAAVSTGRLSVGTHRLTVAVLDSDGQSTSQSVAVTVVRNDAPEASISAPSGEEVEYGAPVTLAGSVSDQEDEPTALAVAWMSDLDGLLDATPAEIQPSTTRPPSCATATTTTATV
jgi:hypothetical protein